MSERLRTLIVDDSRTFRGIVEGILRDDPHIEVVGSVWNGEKALEFLSGKQVDLVLLDLAMPIVSGIQTLRGIQEINTGRAPGTPRIGVLMVSSLTVKGARETIQALELGAFDFITKPSFPDPERNLRTLRNDLFHKIRSFREDREAYKSPQTTAPGGIKVLSSPGPVPTAAVVIGISTGGPLALLQIIPPLSEVIDIPIFIVLHMPALFTKTFAESLGRKCRARVVECQGVMPVQPGTIYLAAGGKHMLVRRTPEGNIQVDTNNLPPEDGCRPSVNVLFRSAAQVFGHRTIAVVLTGMGSDGAHGLLPLKRAGARIIAQDESTSIVWGMPKSAIDTGTVDKVLPLPNIPRSIYQICKEEFGLS